MPVCSCPCGCRLDLVNPESLTSGTCAGCRHGNPAHVADAQRLRAAQNHALEHPELVDDLSDADPGL